MNIQLFIASLLKRALIRVLVGLGCFVFSVVVTLAIAFTVFDFASAWKTLAESDDDNGADFLLAGLLGGTVESMFAILLWVKFLAEFHDLKFASVIVWSLVRFPVFALAIYGQNFWVFLLVGVTMTPTTGTLVYSAWGTWIVLRAFVKELSRSCREAALEAHGNEKLPE